MILRMLNRLQPMMGEFKPNQQICAAMVKLIEAEEVLATSISSVVEAQSATSAYPTAKASPSRSPSTMSPSSLATHWSVVDQQDGISPDDINKHLTVEEMNQVQQLVRERQAASDPSLQNANNETEMA